MTTVQSLPQKVDSNLTVEPPEKITIKYKPNYGWYIRIEHRGAIDFIHNDKSGIMYFKDAGEPLQYCIDRHLVVSKAYDELNKAVKQSTKKTTKKAADK